MSEIGSEGWLRERFPNKDWHRHRRTDGRTDLCDGTPSDCRSKPRIDREPVQCPSCGAWSGEWCDSSCPTCDQSIAGFIAEDRGEPFPPCVLGHPRAHSAETPDGDAAR